MKCRIMRDFISVYTICCGKKNHDTKKDKTLENYNLTSLDMYNVLSKVYCIKPEGRIQKYTPEPV